MNPSGAVAILINEGYGPARMTPVRKHNAARSTVRHSTTSTPDCLETRFR